jgi:hypothetical protein
MTQPSWLKTAARRSVEHAWMLGHVFEKYRQFENKSPEELATQLGCSLETLAWLSLCRRPDEERFAEDLSVIAERFNVDPNGLAEIIRHVESLGALEEWREDGDTAGAVLQMAAHDRASDDETES